MARRLDKRRVQGVCINITKTTVTWRLQFQLRIRLASRRAGTKLIGDPFSSTHSQIWL
ncbi:hypothetical protein J6590_098510 [Homalodisca vitripennis]|nr:hypothetical protein J6590_098510 [Homalodisca vitripennis]